MAICECGHNDTNHYFDEEPMGVELRKCIHCACVKKT